MLQISSLYKLHFQKKNMRNSSSLWSPCVETYCHSPEEGLEVLWQFRAASIARVHGDEDAHRRIQANLLPKEAESLLPVSDGILDAFHLVGDQRKTTPSIPVEGWTVAKAGNPDTTQANCPVAPCMEGQARSLHPGVFAGGH